MIKRFFIVYMIVFSLVFLMIPCVSYADVVFGNDFFYQNEDKTEPVEENSWGRLFVINSPAGFVYAKDEPGMDYIVGNKRFNNGEIVYIEATYIHEGEYWGVMSPSHSYMFPGWIPMEELLLVFEQQDFESVNKDNFYDYTGSYDAVLSAKKLVEWQWPGSDREKRINDNEGVIARSADVLYAYTDSDGREWGRTIYDRWICLSDPENSKIPAFYPAPDPARWSHDGNYDWPSADAAKYPAKNSQGDSDHENPGPSGFPKAVPLIIFVIAVIAGTAILIRKFRKPRVGR